jgi:sugar lactone lactonase YvrE
MPHPSTSSAYGIWSLNEVRDAERGDNWPRLPVGFALSSAVYDSVSFSVASQSTASYGLTFNNDGTKMYVVNAATEIIYQYSLSTAYDISTASYDSVSFNAASQVNLLVDITFNNDGTKMYLIGTDADTVFQYSLSTAFNISTASYDNKSFNAASQEATTFSITFNSDGTKMYIMGIAGDDINQYTLSTAFDVSTASFDNVTFSVGSQDTYPVDLVLNASGTKMLVLGVTGDSVYQYSLSTGFDISTASYDSVSFSVASQASDAHGLAVNDDGTKMYIVGYTGNTVYQYSIEE